MATTDYAADYIGRAVIDLVDGVNDAGYLGRHVIEGDRDYLGRALIGAPIPVTTQAPEWVDDEVNGGGSWTTASQTGVTYSPASGTAAPGESVTVTATAGEGYVIDGEVSWSHTFPAAP